MTMFMTCFFKEAVKLENLVFLAGFLHLFQLPAALVFAPKMLNWKEDFAKLTAMNRTIFNMLGGGILLASVGAGVVVLVAPAEVAGGSRLGTAFCGYLALMWLHRAWIQIFVYSSLWPGGRIGRLSYYGLLTSLTVKTGIYSMAFVLGLMKLWIS
ncbi:MAG: hypothetical protein A2X33_07075 [Elusimicrobia bacterium GWA2_51_34]|nr:MAG: hypothetical protein A2X33_07075 [Elusimicrobia bacterium GWA2_51_34]HAF95337.1 hypothetical protein [Elusimicrobiota bacterium]